jgi:YD repeat-containing protein
LLTETAAGSVNATLAFDYDADFNLASETLTSEDGSAHPIDYGYDADGLLIETVAEGRALTRTRDGANGALVATSIGAITTGHAHDAFGEPDSVTALHAPDPLFEARYRQMARPTTRCYCSSPARSAPVICGSEMSSGVAACAGQRALALRPQAIYIADIYHTAWRIPCPPPPSSS